MADPGERPSVSVVVPCYRSAASLPELVARLEPALRDCADDFEIVLVVDGSPDDTWSVASELADSHDSVVALRLSRNYGQHQALLAGVREARFDLVVTMDDDLQHRPETVPALLDALGPDVDLVYGVSLAEEHSVFRNTTSRALKSLLARTLGVPHAQSFSAFRAFRTRLRAGFADVSGPATSLDVMLSWTTARVAAVEVPMDQRAHGRSNYSLRMLVAHALTMVLGYSTAPLRAATYLGLAFGVVGLGLMGYVLVSFLAGDVGVPGFTMIASMVAMFSAAQLVSLGLLGEYLGRVHGHSIGRPSYLVADRSDRTA